MAVGLRGFFRLNSLTNSLLPKINFVNGIRFMYTEAHLGIKAYETTRYIFRNQFVSIEDTFRNKMREICDKDDGIIYTEDMKAMIHLIQPNDNDLQLVADMLLKYNKGSKDKYVSAYAFGPVVMRMLYYLNQPTMALSMYTNDEYKPLFNYYTALKLLLCLLMKNHMYQEVIDVFLKTSNDAEVSYSLPLSTLMFAACYRLNTEETAEIALNFWHLHCSEKQFSVRAIVIVASLAIKHNRPDEALEVLAAMRNEHIMSYRNLKLLANMYLGRYLNVIALLKCSVDMDTPVKHRYLDEVVYQLEEKLAKDDAEEREEIKFLLNKLRSRNQIESDKSLEDVLFAPLIMKGTRDLAQNSARYVAKNNKIPDSNSISAFN